VPLLIALMRRILDVRVSCQESARASDGKTFVVEQALNLKNRFDVFTAVQPMPTGTFHRLQCGKFRLPVAQHKRLRRSKPAQFADAEKSFVRERRSVVRFRCWSSAGHVYLYRRPISWTVNPCPDGSGVEIPRSELLLARVDALALARAAFFQALREADGRADEIEFLAELILQEALVAEMQRLQLIRE
jgi:hypothetical protein